MVSQTVLKKAIQQGFTAARSRTQQSKQSHDNIKRLAAMRKAQAIKVH